MKSIRAAVVGTVFIGPVHVEGLRRAGVEVAAILGSSPEKSRAAALRLGIPPQHSSLEDVLADDSIDTVHLTTPNRFHFKQAAEVLRARKHVLCEKPLAMTSGESAELVRIARKSGCAAGVAYSESPNELWIGHRDRANETLIRDPSLLHESARNIANYPGGHNEGFPDIFKQLFHSFYAYIAAGDFSAPPSFPTFADGHREILLCEAVLRSHREQRWVTVEKGE